MEGYLFFSFKPCSCGILLAREYFRSRRSHSQDSQHIPRISADAARLLRWIQEEANQVVFLIFSFSENYFIEYGIYTVFLSIDATMYAPSNFQDRDISVARLYDEFRRFSIFLLPAL